MSSAGEMHVIREMQVGGVVSSSQFYKNSVI